MKLYVPSLKWNKMSGGGGVLFDKTLLPLFLLLLNYILVSHIGLSKSICDRKDTQFNYIQNNLLQPIKLHEIIYIINLVQKQENYESV